jgi:predicted XRE-type DNA-binding protein
LFLGTQADNNADRDAKGRNVYFQGERHGRSKLTQAQVNQIRSSRDKQQEIAQKFGIKQPQVSKIKNRQRWNSSEE